VARSRGLPSFDAQAGPVGRTLRYFAPPAEKVFVIDPGTAASYAEDFRLYEDRVLVVGSPRLDLRVAASRALVEGAESPLRGGRAVYLATQPVDDAAMLPVVRLVADACARLRERWPDIRLVIGLHPNEADARLEQYAAICAERFDVQIGRGLDAYATMLASSAVLTYFSTIGLEAAALGRPAGAVNPFLKPPIFDLVAAGAAEAIPSIEACEAFLEAAFLAGGARPPPRHLDGRARQRITEIVREQERIGDAAGSAPPLLDVG
jgi:hypothetical protein